MQIDHPKEKCKNPSCACEVEAGHPYCSEHCRSSSAEYSGSGEEADAGGGSCACEHEECADKQ